MPNTVENRVLELPNDSKSVETIRERLKKYAKILEELYPQNKEGLKKSNLYMSLIIYSELLLNGKVDFRELYQELKNEGIISDYGDDLRYEKNFNYI